MKLKLANYLLFQLGWFACVIGAARGWPAAGPLVVAGIVVLHLWVARRPARESLLLAACAGIGGLFDSLLLATGWIAYPNGAWIPGAAPYWIVSMWVLFGATLNLSLGWLRGRPLLAAALGAAGAPLSYLAGAELGAMTLLQPGSALAALAFGWAGLMPLLAALASRLDGFAPAEVPSWVHSGWRDQAVTGASQRSPEPRIATVGGVLAPARAAARARVRDAAGRVGR